MNEVENRALMEEVSEEELKLILTIFQKDKGASMNGWGIDFFEGYFELISKELLGVVNE